MSNKLTINLSSTAFGTSACVLRLYRTVVQGYKTIPSAKIVYGQAIHKFVDTMYQTGGELGVAFKKAQEVFMIPKELEVKSPHINDFRHLQTVASNLWFDYIQTDDQLEVIEIGGKPATEITFSFPYYEDDYVIINLAGTLDRIGKIKGGCYVIPDWKTTSWSYSPASYFRRYELSKQLRMYRLALTLAAEQQPDSTLGQLGKQRVGTCIDAIFIKSDPNATKFIRSEIFAPFSEDEINKFRLMIDDTIQRLVKAIRTGYMPKEGILNGSCEGKYPCSFWDVCKNNDAVGEMLLKRDFKQVPFEPLNYNEIE